jgi:hypothetical protein
VNLWGQFHRDVTDMLLVSDRSACSQMLKLMDDSNIAYVGPSAARKPSAGQGLYAVNTDRRSLVENGFRLIGEAAIEVLKQSDGKN